MGRRPGISPEPLPQGPRSGALEIPFQELDIQSPPLRVGTSKTVHKAQWQGREVAAVTMRNNADKEVAEVEVFERLGRHPSLTRLLGLSRNAENQMVLVTEFARDGSLSNVLENLDEEGRSPSNLVLMQCAMQVCEGMEQIAEEGLIHRNLALHNVLVFEFDCDNHRAVRVKVADYGLTCDGMVYYGGAEALPLRWMPPEAIRRRRWSEKSDVWAFGVLMWELWSSGIIPYTFLDNESAARCVVNGDRLQRPDRCPASAYAVMQRCWAENHADRPTFRELKADLLDLYVELARTQGGARERPPMFYAYAAGS